MILAGDFNLHMDVAENPDSAAFMELLDMFGLQNHVDFPTHSSGHTLDLILTGRDTRIVSGVRNHSHLPSDHIAVSFRLDIGRPGVIRKRVSCQNLKTIDMDTLWQDLSSAVNVDVPDDILFNFTSMTQLCVQFWTVMHPSRKGMSSCAPKLHSTTHLYGKQNNFGADMNDI